MLIHRVKIWHQPQLKLLISVLCIFSGKDEQQHGTVASYWSLNVCKLLYSINTELSHLPIICLLSTAFTCKFVTIIVLLILSVLGIPLAIVMLVDECKAMKGIPPYDIIVRAYITIMAIYA